MTIWHYTYFVIASLRSNPGICQRLWIASQARNDGENARNDGGETLAMMGKMLAMTGKKLAMTIRVKTGRAIVPLRLFRLVCRRLSSGYHLLCTGGWVFERK